MGIQVEESDVALPGTIIPPEAFLPPSAPEFAGHLKSIIDDLESSVSAIPDGADGAIVGNYSKRTGWLGAVVVRVPGGFHLKGFIGQDAGHQFDWGIGVLKTFNF